MKRPIVQNQKVQAIDSRLDYEGWSNDHYSTPLDNPDMLEHSNENLLYGNGTKPYLAELIIERFTDELGNFPILSAKENVVLKLYLEGLDVTTVAKQLGIRKQTVNSYLKRIGNKLRKLTKAVDF